MKRILLLALSLFMAVSCYDDSALWEEIKDHENRIVKLETLCNQMNTNITSLQTIVSALQSNDFITNVSPVTENGKEIGYTITFSKSGTITVYHGKDGKDGENGKDGTDGEDGKDGEDGQNGQDGAAPVIGVKQDTDGVYYWTLNGDWLRDSDGNKIPTTGKDGKDGEDGADGADGEDGAPGHDGAPGQDGTDGSEGAPGKDGEDGITPKLKIEEGYWYVSYDNGKTWERLEKAVEESDDCFFKNVSQDETAVYFTLTDGTVITIPLRQALSISFEIPEIPALPYYTFKVKYTIEGGSGESEVGTICEGNLAALVEPHDENTGEIKITVSGSVRYGKVVVYVNNNGSSVLKTLDLVSYVKDMIRFEDEIVEKACLEYFDSNGDGLLSFMESADVTTEEFLRFEFPAEGKLFKEFQYFTFVTKVPDSCFQDSMIEEVILPESITEIDGWAFYNCSSLKELEIPDGVTEIKQHTFDGCISLQRIKIPSTVETIDLYAFGWPYSDPLSQLNLSVIEVDSIDDWMNINFLRGNQPASFPIFEGYNIFPELVVENGNLDYIIPEGTTVVMPGPLTGVGIKTITLPSSVTAIEDRAFLNCRLLEKINIPSSVKSIGVDAFSGCRSLKEIHISSFEEWLDIDFEDTYSNPLVASSGVLIDKNGNQIKAVSLPEGTTVIKSGMFTGFDDIEHITIPSTVTTIEANAFAGCANLKEITLPEGVESIGNNAFTDCSNLKEVTLPKSIRSIGAGAFSGCVSVEKVYIENVEHWLNIEFGHTSSNPMLSSIAENGNAPVLIDSNGNQITNIDIPEGTTVVECGPYCGLVGLQTLEIPSSVTTIEPYAFEGCVNLSKVIIPSSLTSYERAFANSSLQILLKNLKEVVFSEGVSIISSDAFYRCVGIEEVTIPSSVKTIGVSAFCRCEQLKVLNLSEGLETIGQSAFSICTSLSGITIPSSVKTIDGGAFSYCTGLTEITLSEGLETIGQSAFSSCTSLSGITIPSSVKTIGDWAFSNCTGLTEITLSEGLDTIGQFAFSECTGLTEITIPSSVKTIGNLAFVQCIALKEVLFNEGIETIPLHAFQGCTSLEELVFPSSVVKLTGGLWGCTSLSKLYFRNSTPPVLQDRNLGVSEDCKIYVPYDVVGAYKSAESWAYHRDAIIGYDFENGKVVE